MTAHLVLREHLQSRLAETWPSFLELRRRRLVETDRPGGGAERVAELIVADLFTHALDWHVDDLNHQIGYADLLLTRLGIKYLVIETKRPGALAWSEAAVEAALEQATRYAVAQGVRAVAVSDGHLLYAADIASGGHHGRALVYLEAPTPPEGLWWLSVHGIYRPVDPTPTPGTLLPRETARAGAPGAVSETLLHPKYEIPARCFAYVGDPSRPGSWHLPFRLLDGSVDSKRLPKAILAILTDYRGATVGSVPEAAIPAVLERLAGAARELGRMPDQRPDTAEAYQLLHDALLQIEKDRRRR